MGNKKALDTMKNVLFRFLSEVDTKFPELAEACLNDITKRLKNNLSSPKESKSTFFSMDIENKTSSPSLHLNPKNIKKKKLRKKEIVEEEEKEDSIYDIELLSPLKQIAFHNFYKIFGQEVCNTLAFVSKEIEKQCQEQIYNKLYTTLIDVEKKYNEIINEPLFKTMTRNIFESELTKQFIILPHSNTIINSILKIRKKFYIYISQLTIKNNIIPDYKEAVQNFTTENHTSIENLFMKFITDSEKTTSYTIIQKSFLHTYLKFKKEMEIYTNKNTLIHNNLQILKNVLNDKKEQIRYLILTNKINIHNEVDAYNFLYTPEIARTEIDLILNPVYDLYLLRYNEESFITFYNSFKSKVVNILFVILPEFLNTIDEAREDGRKTKKLKKQQQRSKRKIRK